MHERLRAGDPLVGTWASLSDPAVAELLAPDFDFVMLDTEHTPHSLETVTEQARAVDAAEGDAVPLARVPWNDLADVKRVLDVGVLRTRCVLMGCGRRLRRLPNVAGVMVPMVDTAADAEAAVSACRYPPAGARGVAASRAADYGRNLREYFEHANESVLTLVQIETPQAVDNADAIAAVEGVDALFVGPVDLSSNLGVFGDWSADRFRDAVDAVLAAGGAADTPVGTLGGSPDDVATLASMGFDFVVAGIDTAYLLGGAKRAKRAAEEALE